MFKLLSLAAAIAVSLLTPLAASAETVAFQSRQNGNYLAFDSSGVLAARAAGPEAQLFELIRLERDRVAFRDPSSGRFLRAGVTAATYLALGERHIRGWETFEMRQDGPDITLRSVQNGKFVRAGVGPETRLAAVSEQARGWETFRLVPVTMQRGPASTGPAPAPDTLASGAARRGPATEANVPADLWFAGRWRVADVHDGAGRGMAGLNDRILREIEIDIDRSGRVAGYSGCNHFTGQIVELGVRNRVEHFVTQKRGCAPARGEIQRAFYDGLTAMEAVAGSPGRMVEVFDRNGRTRLRLVAQR